MTSLTPVRIGYLTIENANDRDAWSGTTFAMMQSLRDAGAIVEPVRVSTNAVELFSKLHSALMRVISSGKHMRNRETWYLKALGARAAKLTKGKKYDAFVSPGTLAVSFASLEAPLFVWTDATLASMINFYPSFTGLSVRTIAQGHLAEVQCLKRCRTAVFSSNWAARGAVDAYGHSNVIDVQFGANLSNPPTMPSIPDKAIACLKAPRFLLVGKDWHVKGGDRAVAAIMELRRRGYPATLRVVGVDVVDPPAGEWFSSTGFVSKNAGNGQRSIAAEYADANFLLILSRADCTPMVIAEAASFGVPAVGAAVGGIPEQIEHGKSGLVVSKPDDPVAIADLLEPHLGGSRYVDLCNGALKASTDRLNWNIAGKRMLEIIASNLN